MNSILINYLLSNFLKTIFKVILIFYSFGIILNLFEEIEFFKNIDTSILTPITLTALYIPNMLIKLFPFIIFISSMWFLLNLRNSKDLLTLKVFGYSNFKIFFVLASTSFIFGWIILFAVNPVTSSMVKYYENTKSKYSRDVDHLVAVNKNGLWIKEFINNKYRIVSSDTSRSNIIKNIKIFNLDDNYNLIEIIYAKTADISENDWVLNEVSFSSFKDGISKEVFKSEHIIQSKYDYVKITSIFKNFDAMSFLDLLLNYQDLQNKGYNKTYLDQNLNSLLSLPFFLFLMTGLASILSMNTLKKSNKSTVIITGLITCVAVYYFKDLSFALGQANRISLSLAAWVPVVAIGLFTSIGVLQINEK